MNFSTAGSSAPVDRLRQELETAQAIVLGAGAGLSAAAGLSYSGERFARHFSDFERRYGFHDMYSGGFYPYGTPEEYWAYWSRHILVNRYLPGQTELYRKLLRLVQGREYFVLTTNVDHQFRLAGFEKERLFYTQGDYGLFQCSRPCCQETYCNEAAVRQMALEQRDLRIPAELLPRCPVCGAGMTVNLRCDHRFVEDAGWHRAAERCEDFLRRHEGEHILYLELGVGYNTPVIIKYPFWQRTAENPRAVYACVNLSDAACPRAIAGRSLCIEGDIAALLNAL